VSGGPVDLTLCETPALVLDRTRLQANLAAMAGRAARLDVALRPHLKTAKSPDVAALAAPIAGGRITVSTLREAEAFARLGYRDILYAVAISPDKVGRVAALLRDDVLLTVLVESAQGAAALALAAADQQVVVPVMIEVDSDGHRAGLAPEDPDLLVVARTLAEGPWTRLEGVLAHAGSSYDCRSLDAITAVAERERARAVEAARRIREAGLDVPQVSVGSTPTALMAANLDGVTELRAGVYMFFDLVMAGLGVCRLEDIALTVLTSVIGHQASSGAVIVDAGWMALSRDRGTANQAVDQGYGVVCDLAGRPIGDLLVGSTNQEHGLLARRDGGRLDPAEFPIGRRLRILPNHACAAGAQHDGYLVTEGTSSQVLARWPRFRGW
jgi:D-serine deaminase-like pyridoxal phosphate-dependent protein